ncbi:MAG: hypothetical protein WAQ53_08240 [Thiofilum sp.]|uniref:hypothetical protein n=1 Tax=Thiofilum sp. TaxID=2212733 RepID=UPI0025DD4278|nr:hypothetical protein [Thiofilum sp.]MBK8453812.1 hypothetical protein [Thiofilum sp.]
MEALRSIQTVANGEIHLQLPKQFWGQEVEIIVLTAPQKIMPTIVHKKSLRGSLKRYANPALIAQEQDAWQTSVDYKLGKHIQRT